MIVKYWLSTPIAAGTVAFNMSDDSSKETLVEDETSPIFRIAFGKYTRLKALDRWAKKGYRFEEKE